MEQEIEKEKIYCIFNSQKENITAKISQTFEIFLKEELANNKEKV